MSKEKVTINGRPAGRIKAGWLLFKETWRYFKADSEVIAIPLITTFLNLVLLGIIGAVVYYIATSTGYTLPTEEEPLTLVEYAFIFAIYVAGAFCLALSEAAIANTVYTRAHGGNASLSDSLKRAFSHWGSLLMWSVITSTVGLVLKAVAERSKLLGRIVVSVLGVAWSVLTYFVVPAMVIDNKSAFASINKSGTVFKTTWGETLISSISLGIIFFLLYLLLFIAFFGGVVVLLIHDVAFGVITLSIISMICIIALALLQTTMQTILKTLLYIYAAEGITPQNFNPELLEKMLKRETLAAATPPAPTMTPTT